MCIIRTRTTVDIKNLLHEAVWMLIIIINATTKLGFWIAYRKFSRTIMILILRKIKLNEPLTDKLIFYSSSQKQQNYLSFRNSTN